MPIPRCVICNNGSPMPVFETDEDRTYFLTTIPVHPDFITSNDVIDDVITALQLNDRERAVLEAIHADGTLTIAQIAQQAGVSMSTVDRTLKKLRKNQMLVREGGKKTGCWKIQTIQ